MNSLVPGGSLLPLEEVLPAGLKISGLSRSSVITQRRRVRVAPQTGINYGAAPPTVNANAAGSQIQFVVSDAGGMIDPSSVVLVYNHVVAGTGSGFQAGAVPDDGHPFYRVQVSLNGQLLDDIQQAAKYTNAEAALSTSESWYKTAGSFCGFELLNGELAQGSIATSAATTTGTILGAYNPAWGDVSTIIGSGLATRYQFGTSAPFNPLGGQQRILPLGLVSGVGRMRNLLPLNVLGELQFTFYAGSNGEMTFDPANSGDYYSLRGVYLEYDVCVPHPAYAALLAKVATDPQEQGLALPYESVIMASSGTIGASASTLTDTSVIVSRATNNLVRSFVVQQITSVLTSAAFPSQSCFSHAGTAKIQWRVGSTYYPSIPAEGDASIFAMTQLAYGAAGVDQNTGFINRQMWRQNTLAALTAPANNEGSVHYNYADRFIPAYGFQMIKGHSEPIDLDGVSLSGASGSQAVVIITSAPVEQMTPLVGLVATRVIHAHGGQVRVQGA